MGRKKQTKKEIQAWSKRLKALRLGFNWSQRGLAERWYSTHGAVRRWESGENTIPGTVMALIEEYERKLQKAELD